MVVRAVRGADCSCIVTGSSKVLTSADFVELFHTETKTEADGQVFWQRLELPGLDGLGHHFGAEKGPNILPFCNSTLSSSNMVSQASSTLLTWIFLMV